MSEQEEFDGIEGCPYCGTMWYELFSEGSPCGIGSCDVHTCCNKAWYDHIKQYHLEANLEEYKYLLKEKEF
jgi:hypothetical protein